MSAPHKECGCLVCEERRLREVKTGALYRPNRNATASPCWPSFWRYRQWKWDGWSNRFSGKEIFTVVKILTCDESPEDFHLAPVLCLSTCGKQFVTSGKWIVSA